MDDKKFELRRLALIETVKAMGIVDTQVLKALSGVLRHKFMDKSDSELAYINSAQSIGEGQTISQPYIVALMTEALSLTPMDKVLEIGTGSGYQAAVLCELAREVYSVERIEKLCKKADSNLKKLGYSNYKLKLSDGSAGWPENSPYDAIIVTAQSPDVPEPLLAQLKTGGRMVIPTGRSSPQDLLKIVKNEDSYSQEVICKVVFVPLIGKYAW